MTTISGKRWWGWVAIGLASDATDIAWQLWSGTRLPLSAELIRAVLVLAIALATRGFVRRFALTLTAFLVGNWIQRTLERHWSWFQHAAVSRQMVADAWLALIPSGLIALTLIGGGLTRREIYLTAGRPGARVRGFGRVRWTQLAPLVLVVLVFGLTEQLRFILGATHATERPRWVAAVALSLSFAAINAANEEFRFRFVLVAQGSRAFGERAALWMTSLNFGLAHWNGHPGGPTGVLTTTLFAMLLCRSLYDTQGGLWAWLMHAAGDVIILMVVLFRVG